MWGESVSHSPRNTVLAYFLSPLGDVGRDLCRTFVLHVSRQRVTRQVPACPSLRGFGFPRVRAGRLWKRGGRHLKTHGRDGTTDGSRPERFRTREPVNPCHSVRFKGKERRRLRTGRFRSICVNTGTGTHAARRWPRPNANCTARRQQQTPAVDS